MAKQTTSAKPHRFVSASDIQDGLETLYNNGISAGLSTGFEGLDSVMTLKLGTTFYIYGQPGSGKTELWLEILVNTTELYGWKHVIYSPEGGEPKDIIGELISKKYGKPFYKNIPGSISEQDFYNGRAWVDEYFRIIDPQDENITVESFYATCDLAEEHGFKAHTTTIDPWNELLHDFTKAGGHRDVYLENMLGVVRKNAIKHNRINAILTHIADQKIHEKDGKRFYPPPTARELAGGQAWHRKGMNMLAVWRPPNGMFNDNGQPYEENEVHVTVQKYKPKGVGKRGTAVMFYDWKKNRYYEGNQYYAKREKNKNIIQPNMNFYESAQSQECDF